MKTYTSASYCRYITANTASIEVLLNAAIERTLVAFFDLEHEPQRTTTRKLDLIALGQSLIAKRGKFERRAEVYLAILRKIVAEIAIELSTQPRIELLKAVGITDGHKTFLVEAKKEILPDITAWHLKAGFRVMGGGFSAFDQLHGELVPVRMPMFVPKCLKVASCLMQADPVAKILGKEEAALATNAIGPNLCLRPVFVAGFHVSEASEVQVTKAKSKSLGITDDALNIDTSRGSLNATTPAIKVEFSSVNFMNGVVEIFERSVLASGADQQGASRYVDALLSGNRRQTAYPLQAPTVFKGPKRYSIGMATYDDYDGAYFTIQALRMYHPEVMDDTEIVVVDNNPTGACATALKDLEKSIPNLRYEPLAACAGSAPAKNYVFEVASGQIVLHLDCHVFLVQGAVSKLFKYIENNQGSRDLLQGPLIRDDLISVSTHWEPVWSRGMWQTDVRGEDPDADPFEIPMQGMGLFASVRRNWLGFNKDFAGFGGEEGYIHEKYRQHGSRTLCLPFLRWMHRFSRPLGVPYDNTWEDRYRNYFVGFRELGLDLSEFRAHMASMMGKEAELKQFQYLSEALARKQVT